jgi:hypothetical protein
MTVAEIIAFSNAMLGRAEIQSTIEVDVLAILDEIAGLYVLEDNDATQTLTSTSLYLTYPADALDGEQAIREVVLTDSSSIQLPPLEVIPGGWHEYKQEMESFGTGSRSSPSYYIAHDRKIYLYPAPNAAYTTSIDYYKRHPADVTTIILSDDWKNTLKYGVTRQVALHFGQDAAVGRWDARYQVERELQRIAHAT